VENKVGLETLEKKNCFLPMSGIQSRALIRPVRSLATVPSYNELSLGVNVDLSYRYERFQFPVSERLTDFS
jgi:hypothetical protein